MVEEPDDYLNVMGWFFGALFTGLIIIQAAARYGELSASVAWVGFLIIVGLIWRNSRRKN